MPEEKGSFSHLVYVLEKRYGTMYQLELLRQRYQTRMRTKGELLLALAQDLDSTTHKAYPAVPTNMFSVLVRDQFVDVLDSVDLKIQVK